MCVCVKEREIDHGKDGKEVYDKYKRSQEACDYLNSVITVFKS